MSLYTRNSGTVYQHYANYQSNQGLVFIVRGNPKSCHFVAPCGDQPREIVTWMLALQTRRYGHVVDQSYPILINNVKRLLKKYTPDQIKRAVKYAVIVSRYPYTFKLVREILEQENEV